MQKGTHSKEFDSFYWVKIYGHPCSVYVLYGGRLVRPGPENDALSERLEEKTKKFGWKKDHPDQEAEWKYR